MATKKTMKVEIPIDQRETFVSIQKSFADAESIGEKLKTLYDLQKADTEIDKIHQLRGDLPAEVESLEAEVASAQERIEDGGQMLESYAGGIEKYQQDIEEYDVQIAKYQKQLENIANSREYDSINKELENLSLLRQIAEKNIGETRAAISAKKVQIEELKDRMTMLEEDLEAKKEELSQIVNSTSKEEDTLISRRDALAAKVDERTMSAYNRIRSSVKNHLAVVGIYNGDSCGGCFNTITSQKLIEVASGKKLIICEHCGRIIVNSDFE